MTDMASSIWRCVGSGVAAAMLWSLVVESPGARRVLLGRERADAPASDTGRTPVPATMRSATARPESTAKSHAAAVETVGAAAVQSVGAAAIETVDAAAVETVDAATVQTVGAAAVGIVGAAKSLASGGSSMANRPAATTSSSNNAVSAAATTQSSMKAAAAAATQAMGSSAAVSAPRATSEPPTHPATDLANGGETATGAQPVSSALPPDHRWAVPDSLSTKDAEQLVRQTYAREYQRAHSGLEGRARLGEFLLDRARQTSGESAAVWVMLRDARDHGAGAGEAVLALRAIDEIERRFAVDDAAEMRVSALLAAGRAAPNSASARGALARGCLRAWREVIVHDDFEGAARIATLAQSAATKSQDLELVARARAKSREVDALRRRFEAAQAGRRRLEIDPLDPRANHDVGWYDAMVKGNWQAALPRLARSADPPWAAMAGADLAAGNPSAAHASADPAAENPSAAHASADPAAGNPSAARAAADAWADIAENHQGLARQNLLGRSALLYRRAMPGLEGLAADAVKRRLTSITAEQVGELLMEPGLLASMGRRGSATMVRRVDPNIDFDWGTGAPAEGVPADDFSIEWTGYLIVCVPGRYTLGLTGNTGAILHVDERMVLNEPGLERKRTAATAELDLSEGLHTLRLEYWETTGIARMHLSWTAPGEGVLGAIPPGSLCHDPLIKR